MFKKLGVLFIISVFALTAFVAKADNDPYEDLDGTFKVNYISDTSLVLKWDSICTEGESFFYQKKDWPEQLDYPECSANSAGVRQCTIALTDLTASTVYDFGLRCTTGYIKSGYYFTIPAKISESQITVSDITSSSAKISWTTDTKWATAITYMTADDESSQASIFNSAKVLSHSVSLENLKANTKYKYKIDSVDRNGGVVSDYLYFTTLAESSQTADQTTETETPKTDTQIDEINNAAENLLGGKISELLSGFKELRNLLREAAAELKYLKAFSSSMKLLNSSMQTAIRSFVAYGADENTKKLGEGERAAVVNSFIDAFGKLPTTQADLADMIKIANGRFPTALSSQAETKAKEQFLKIYKRAADLANAKDNAAIKIMAYGLRQKAANRNLNSEKAGIKTFKNIFGSTPKTTSDWNIMQAITYSGASR